MPGLFVTFEGTEGSGKSTQIQLLAARLERRGHAVLQVREPGGTAIGEALRNLLKHDPAARGLCPEAEVLLMNASRAQLVRAVILPALAANQLVLCDRFYDSTIAYQIFGRGLDELPVRKMIEFATGGLQPDLTLLLRLPIAISEARREVRHSSGAGDGGRADRIEEEDREFFRRVEQGYEAIAASLDDRVRPIDASGPVAEVESEIWRWVEPLLDCSALTGGLALKTAGEY